jgi:hypothetical protein
MDRETLVKLNGDVAQLKGIMQPFNDAAAQANKGFIELGRTLNLEAQRRNAILRALFYSSVKAASPTIGRKRRARRARGRRLEVKAGNKTNNEFQSYDSVCPPISSNHIAISEDGELSFVYRAHIEHTSGVTPDGSEYKAIVRSIKPISARIKAL